MGPPHAQHTCRHMNKKNSLISRFYLLFLSVLVNVITAIVDSMGFGLIVEGCLKVELGVTACSLATHRQKTCFITSDREGG